MSRSPSTQTTHLGLDAIEDDTIQLIGGQLRAVLEVGAINFALQREREQEALVAGFAAFLNSLSFPVQILVRVLPIDLAGYLVGLEWRLQNRPDHLTELARDHVAFLRRLVRTSTLLERRFFLVVPAQDAPSLTGRRWLTTSGRRDTGMDAAFRQLRFRCEEVVRQLDRCGLAARRLPTAELIQLFHACWCPELARTQRLQGDVADSAPPVVRARGDSGRRH